MEIIVILITISICLAILFLVGFIWANRSGQFEDTQGPAIRMLFDDEAPIKSNNHKKSKS